MADKKEIVNPNQTNGRVIPARKCKKDNKFIYNTDESENITTKTPRKKVVCTLCRNKDKQIDTYLEVISDICKENVQLSRRLENLVKKEDS